MQHNSPLDFIDDFLLVQKPLIKLVFNEALNFPRVDKITWLILKVVDWVLHMKLVEIRVFLTFLCLSFRILWIIHSLS